MKENKENSTSASLLSAFDLTKPCWYWDKKDLAHTPSQLENLDPATEARYRREGARFIFDVGTRLGLHYDTLATGIIYFHRFYMFHSFKQFPRYVTGGCCLFLAGKVEETPKKCKDIIKTARSLLNDVQFSQFGDDPKEEVMVLERILLQTIKFDLQVEHPYQYLLKYAKQLKGDKNKIQKLVQMAWTFVNDSLCTTLSLQWEPEIIAVAVMYLAGRLCKFEIQEWTSKPMYKRWWEQFVQDVPVELLEDICHQILDLYSQGKQQMPQPTTSQSSQQLQSVQQPQPASSQQQQPQQSSDQPQTKETRQQQQETPSSVQQPAAPAQSKKPSPQSSPPRQVKRPVVASPKEDGKITDQTQPSKIPKLETSHLPIPSTLPPPDRKATPAAVSLGEGEQVGTGDSIDMTKAPVPSLTHPAPVHQPLPLLHRPPPPPPSSYITGMSTTSSYMSGEGYQSLESLMKAEAPSYGTLPPAYGPPSHIPYHPHVYPPNPPPPVPPPPPPTSFPPPSIPPPTPGYPPPPTYNPNFPPPPRMPPTHTVPPPGMGLPPASYPPPSVPPGGQPQVPPPLPLPGMPPVGGLSRGGWLR